MKSKPLLILGIALCLVLGIFAFVKWRGSGGQKSTDDASDDKVPTMVAVQTDTLRRMTLHNYVNGYGVVEAAPAAGRRSAAGGILAAPGAGVVAQVDVVAGQKVKKGEVLVKLNSATATFDYAKAEVERQQRLFAQQNTSQKNLQDAEAQLASLEVVAPVAGTVTRLDVQPGQAVDVNAPVAEVIDLNRLAVATKIPESQAGGLKVGEEVQIPDAGGKPANGQNAPTTTKLAYVSPAVDATDGTISAWAVLPKDSGLRPGEFVPVKIVTETRSDCLVAPDESVVNDNNGNSVIARVKGVEATQVRVQTGLQEDHWIEITGTNLQAGDSVVTVGAYGLPDQTQIKIVNPPADRSSATPSVDAQ